LKTVLTQAAKADIEKEASYYESQSEGLGVRFVDRVLEAVDRIGENPLGYRERIDDVRMAPVRKFPFGLWFKILDGAVIIACLDSRRNPVLARERVKGVIEIKKPEGPN
jgi:toxin ParE1/3/4